MSAFASFSNTKYSHVLIFSSLNGLNTLSPYQKSVQVGKSQKPGSGFIKQSFVVEIDTVT